jgi:CubicO group peptidase (beta-lactamase class C family)
MNSLLNNRIHRRQRSSICGDSRPRLPALRRVEGSIRAQHGSLATGTTSNSLAQRKPRNGCSQKGQKQHSAEQRICLERKDALTLHNPASMTQETQVRGCPLCHIMDFQMATPNPSSMLIGDVERQDQVFRRAFALLREAIRQQAFPAASVAITHHGRLIGLKSFGQFTYERDSPSVNQTMLFDLASLTKVVATTPMAMLLYERGLLDLEAPVSAIVPEFIHDAENDPRRREVTLRMLLSHSSGLPAYEKLYLKCRTRDELLHTAITMPLAANPATIAVYSDIGFMILGIALERLADESLDRFCQREIFAPLAMTSTTFNPPVEIRAQIPPTAHDQTFRNKIIQGEVQDENAYILGGVAPQAGLFSTGEDLAKFAHAMLNEGRPVFRPETVDLFARRESAPKATSRALGWDTPSAPSQSGKYFSPNSFGHLGYTGTSLWIDPTRQLSITLLTNRTWPDCSSQAIKQVRPQFHDSVIELLDRSVSG